MVWLSPADWRQLASRARQAKQTLTTADAARLEVSLSEEENLDLTITRDAFRSLTAFELEGRGSGVASAFTPAIR